MALPNEVDGGELSALNGTEILNVYRPAATASGWQDYFISGVNFLKAVTDDIAGILSTITGINNSITALNNMQSKTRTANQNSAFTFTQAADSDISDIYLFYRTGAPTIMVGTSAGTDDVCNATTLSTLNKDAHHRISVYSTVSRTIYVTITGGSIDFVRYEKKSINT